MLPGHDGLGRLDALLSAQGQGDEAAWDAARCQRTHSCSYHRDPYHTGVACYGFADQRPSAFAILTMEDIPLQGCAEVSHRGSAGRVVREHGGKVAADLEPQLDVSDHTEEQGHKHQQYRDGILKKDQQVEANDMYKVSDGVDAAPAAALSLLCSDLVDSRDALVLEDVFQVAGVCKSHQCHKDGAPNAATCSVQIHGGCIVQRVLRIRAGDQSTCGHQRKLLLHLGSGHPNY
mmetsp:Transcript_119550/g.283897  ORF Transcript_119550/g.283897 Transcript_119550/m.283897 type:complete len:233 (+) Transcript_119550:91-789(+)